MVVMSNLYRLPLLMFSWLRNSTQPEWNLTFNITFCRTGPNDMYKDLITGSQWIWFKTASFLQDRYQMGVLVKRKSPFPLHSTTRKIKSCSKLSQRAEKILASQKASCTMKGPKICVDLWTKLYLRYFTVSDDNYQARKLTSHQK